MRPERQTDLIAWVLFAGVLLTEGRLGRDSKTSLYFHSLGTVVKKSDFICAGMYLVYLEMPSKQ